MIKGCPNQDFLNHKFHQEPWSDKLGFGDARDVVKMCA